MKIAVLSDIHSNIQALKEVVNEVLKDGVKKFLFLGDFIGYYYYPAEVLDLVSKLDAIFIQGNHERILKDLIQNRISPKVVLEKYGHGHQFALDQLSIEQKDFLINLPVELNVLLDGIKIRMCHGSPMDPDYYIYPDTPSEILNKCTIKNVDFVLIGHSHYQFVYKNNDSILVNVGSVGQSRSEGGMAQWALIDTQDKSVQLRSTIYDTSDLEQKAKHIDANLPYIRKILTRLKNEKI